MPPSSAAPVRVVFLTRDPLVHQQGGSTTYALALLHLLRTRGAEVTLVATTAYSRSPRLFFRVAVAPPEGVRLQFPGYRRLGRWYVLPLRPRAWARMAARAATRRPKLHAGRRWLERMWGDRLYTGAWDLTTPTPAESRIAQRAVEAAEAGVVVTNYCIWGPLLATGALGNRRTAVLMHDLLSARVERFREAGLPLDTPPITEAEEMRYLSAAGTVLAAQASEAAAIRPRVAARVVVTPVVLQPRALPPAEVVPERCLFVGSNIVPNQTGLRFLLEAVWPRVRAAVPEATLAVAGSVGAVLDGSDAPPGGWQAAGVERLGMVPSLEAEYARAAVCVVPLLLGTGIKIKLLEALGFGKAIVSTSVGVQGLEMWAPEAVAVADDAETFAGAIIRLLRDPEHRRAREKAALHLAEVHFGAGQQLDPEFVSALL